MPLLLDSLQFAPRNPPLGENPRLGFVDREQFAFLHQSIHRVGGVETFHALLAQGGSARGARILARN